MCSGSKGCSHTNRSEKSILTATILKEGIECLRVVDVGYVPWDGGVASEQSVEVDAALGGVVEI